MAIRRVELESGCFAKAKEDEPMFVLLARDALAPWLVRAWASLRRWQVYIGFKPPSDLDKVTEAIKLAQQMRAWRQRRVETEPSPVTWSDHLPPEAR